MPQDIRGGLKLGIVAAVVVMVALIVTAGVYGFQQASARRIALQQLSEATTLVRDADKVVVEVDEVVRAEITPELSVRASEAASRVPDAIADLRAALELIEDATPALPEEHANEGAALAASAAARIDMLDLADSILKANVAAAAALGPARSGWDHIIAGEKLADQAVAEYNKLTRTAVINSQNLSDKALARYRQARDQFAAAHAAFKEAGLDAFIAYAEEKIALIGISKEADAAFLAGKNVEANKLSERFNAREKEIAEKAKSLPKTPEAAIAAAYDRIASAATAAYFDARDKATKADANLEQVTQ